MTDDRLDQLLSQRFAREANDDTRAVARVMTRLAKPLPRQKVGLLGLLPDVLLDWEFSPAWPRVAALAACAALGFFIGIAGMDGRIDDASALAASSDLSVAFDNDTFSGARP